MRKEEYWKKYNSYLLCRYHNRYIKIWWDPDKFDWRYSYSLCEYCKEYKHIWQEEYLIKKIEGVI